MKHLFVWMLLGMAAFTLGCKEEVKSTDEHPKEYVGKWTTVKKVYSNGVEDVYNEDDDIYYLNEGGKLKRDFRDHRKETRDQQGEWKIISEKSQDGKTDNLYFIKRTPMFNGMFEERFRIVSKTEKEMVLEEGSWGFEKDDARDKYHLTKAE
jgi:hypothetical protein